MCPFIEVGFYYTNKMKLVFLHYNEIYHTITKYYHILSLQDIILLLPTILLFVPVFYAGKQ